MKTHIERYFHTRQARPANSGVVRAFTIWTLKVLSLGMIMPVFAQAPRGAPPSANRTQSPFFIADRGMNHRVWARVYWTTNSLGVARAHTNSYTEIATGMAHMVNGKLIDSDALIHLTPTGAEATNALHTVRFLGNINTAGSIDVTLADGRHLTSNPLCLSYFDTSSGKSVLIAELKDSVGEVFPSGTAAMYQDAFTDFRCDIVYENAISGLEQLIILREQPPSPREWGLDPETTMFQVITEFLNPPKPQISAIQSENDEDNYLNFGPMRMGPGVAFALGSETNQIRVTKHWALLDGRTCLIEQVPFKSIQTQLRSLATVPPGTGSLDVSPGSVAHRLAANQVLPSRRKQRTETPQMKLTRQPLKNEGFAMDYTLSTAQTNLTLQSDTEYYVIGTVSVVSNLVVEGGAIIKFANSPAATIIASNVVCQTGPFQPAIFTAKDDDSVGSPIADSTGTPSGYYASTALNLSAASNPVLSNFRFLYLSNAIAGPNITLKDSQIINCNNVFAAGSSQPSLFNVLVFRANAVLPNTSAATLTAENVTAHFCTNFFGNTSGTVNLTNCLFACVTNWECATTRTNCNAFLDFDVGVFQTAGGGQHYLASSAYRNAGTTNVNTDLLLALRKQTTFAPILCSNTLIALDTVFSPQAQRDTDCPDLGYHYHPLDYLFGTVNTTNGSSVTIGQGTVIGMFGGTDPNDYGLNIDGASHLVCHGSATARNWFASYLTAQEQPVPAWTRPYVLITDDGYEYSLDGSLDFSFTSWSVLGADYGSYLLNITYSLLNCWGCEFHGAGGFVAAFGSLHITNCLFERLEADLAPDANNSEPPGYISSTICSNNFFGGYFDLFQSAYPTYTVLIRDNLFDRSFIYHGYYEDRGYHGGHNGFISGGRRLSPTGTGDVLLSSPPVYQTSSLGAYYLPTGNDLINAGSASAGSVALYHYTTLATQAKETNSLVDIGYHYVAVDGSGNPFDADIDCIPDYIEDSNGNGDGADDPTSWQTYNSANGLSGGAALQVFTPLK